MTLARGNRISEAQAAEIAERAGRAAVAKVRDAMYHGDIDDRILEHLDEQAPEPLSYADVAAMSEAEINENWTQVQKVMAAGPPPSAGSTGSPPPAPTRTGQQPLNEHAAGSAPLSFESLKRMSISEYDSRREEIDAFLARGGQPG